MAELTDLKKQLENKQGASSGISSGEVGSSGGLTGPNIQGQVDFLKYLMGGVVIVLFTAFIAAIIAYFQFVKDANIEYGNTVTQFNKIVNDYNDKRYSVFENRINELEQKVASLSAKQ